MNFQTLASKLPYEKLSELRHQLSREISVLEVMRERIANRAVGLTKNSVQAERVMEEEQICIENIYNWIVDECSNITSLDARRYAEIFYENNMKTVNRIYDRYVDEANLFSDIGIEKYDGIEIGRNLRKSFASLKKKSRRASSFAPDGSPLPEGWSMKVDKASGRIFYVNKGTGEKSWRLPGQSKASKDRRKSTKEEDQEKKDRRKSTRQSKVLGTINEGEDAVLSTNKSYENNEDNEKNMKEKEKGKENEKDKEKEKEKEKDKEKEEEKEKEGEGEGII